MLGVDRLLTGEKRCVFTERTEQNCIDKLEHIARASLFEMGSWKQWWKAIKHLSI